MPDLQKKLLWALALSLLAHVVVLLGPHIDLPVKLAPAPVLEARLEPRPQPPQVAPPTRPPHRVKPQKPAPRTAPQPAVEPVASAPAEAPAAPEPVAAAPEPAPAATEKGPAMPQRVSIRFTVYKGQNGLSVGRAVQTWQLDGDRYRISSVAEATGLFSLFASGKFVQESSGTLTPAGLKPASYRVERGQAADKIDTARFDWQAMTLAVASGGDSRTLKLTEGTQDLLSFMYQLAFTPPQRSAVQLSLTNGRKLDSYAYWVVEEALETPMGRLNTLHLGKQREPDEKDTEVWLAADYHYLPVKISQLDKDGDGLVLLANEIDIKP
jgi:hypothetical protein